MWFLIIVNERTNSLTKLLFKRIIFFYIKKKKNKNVSVINTYTNIYFIYININFMLFILFFRMLFYLAPLLDQLVSIYHYFNVQLTGAFNILGKFSSSLLSVFTEFSRNVSVEFSINNKFIGIMANVQTMLRYKF